ncbi:hypothetical protein KBD33_06155 [Candidatus Gracilibacteria bacterium]|nr:hypothetical protein [Candidatus Gracilibacteria bacterium]
MKTIPSTYNSMLEKFFQVEKIGDYSLANTQNACAFFGNPEKHFKSIHIAGTNGKGSVSKMVFQILKESGKNVGVYTSPHLIDIRERFETEKGQITEEDFVHYADMIIKYGGNLSYFERCAVLAFLYFRDQGAEYGVIEVGLGGRLDATNVITPIVSAITGIGYDHMEFLGETLDEIAYEKGGIIKPGVPVILYNHNSILEKIAQERGSEIIIPKTRNIVTNLLGAHQLRNANIAYEIGKLLGIDEYTINQALLHIDHPGRMQYLYPNLLIDGAHNEEGLTKLREYLSTLDTSPFSEIVYCFNLKAGKNVNLVTNVFSEIEQWHIIEGKNPLLSNAEALKEKLKDEGKFASIITPAKLLEQRENNEKKLFVVFGSLYLLGELLK